MKPPDRAAIRECLRRSLKQLAPRRYRVLHADSSKWCCNVGLPVCRAVQCRRERFDWLFAAEAGIGAGVETYGQFLSAKLGPAEARKWISLRQHIRPFISKCAADTVRLRPALVGFSIMHSQTTASAALAREIKRRLPGTLIVAGGASCDGPMGPRRRPAGAGPDGLPIGVQIIGPGYGDLRTIQLAQRLESLGFAFTPPPGWD